MKNIIVILLLFSLKFSSNSDSDKEYFKEEDIQKICSKCRSGFNETYKNEELLGNISDSDKINHYVRDLIELLKTNFTSDDIMQEYVNPRVINSNIIFIIIIVIIIIIWIILIILVYCKKIIKFDKKENENNFKHHLLAYITALCFLINIILSSISLSYIHKAQTYFNGSICSLLRIYIDLRDGDQAQTTQWKGVKNIQAGLVGNKTTEEELISQINLQEEITNELKNNKYLKETFAKNEENEGYFSNKEVSSPSSLSELVYPEYSRNRKVFLDKILSEYKLKLNNGVINNEKINNINRPIKEDPNLLSLLTKEKLYINRELNDLLETIQLSAEEYLQYLIDISEYVNNIAFPLLYSIFSLSLIFSFIGIIITVLYIRDNKLSIKAKKILSIILHILWNVILFLIVLTGISQIVFKIFEILGEDGSGLLQYATSEENFNSSNSIIFRGAGKVLLETCFREDEDGDLLSLILGKMKKENNNNNSSLSELNLKYLEGIGLAKYSKELEQKNLDTTEGIIKDLENMLNDYSLISFYNSKYSLVESKCQDVFDDLNKYTDYSNPLISRQSDLNDKHTYDKWVSIQKNCENYKQYKYIDDQKNRIEGNKYCMALEQFDIEVAKNFYYQIKTKDLISTTTIDKEFEKYYQCFDKFKKDNQKLLSDNPNFIELTKKYYNELLSLKAQILKGLEISQNIANLLNTIMGNANSLNVDYDIFTIMNCQFIKRDLKVYYNEMEKLRENSIPCLILSVFVFILLLGVALLDILNIYKYKKEEQQQKEYFSQNSINNEK